MRGKRGLRGGARLVLASVATASALTAVVAVGFAADATETTTFGADGIASESLGVHYDETQFTSVVARADGGLLAERNNQVESYLANGSPDPAVPPQPVPPRRRVFPVTGGKSLVLDDSRSTLTRVNGDGSVDTSFSGGTVEVSSEASIAAELTSGKILVIGTGFGGTHERLAWITVELLNPDGSVDRRIWNDDNSRLPVPAYEEEEGQLEISPTGSGGVLVSAERFLLELRADGSPNPGFGGDGLVTELPMLAGARVLPDGAVAAVGTTRGEYQYDLVALRLIAGQPDPAFGPEGMRRFDFGGVEVADVASWAADGSVIVGGRAESRGTCTPEKDCEEVPILVALDPAGNLDAGFGQGGVLRLAALAGSASYGDDGVIALARRPDGSIVAAGSAAPERTVAFLAAFSPQGALLPGFGEGGIVRVRRPLPAAQQLIGFVPQADGKLLAAGTTDLGIDDQPVLIRYAADGSLDRSFGDGAGYVVVSRSLHATGFAANGLGQVLIGLYEAPRSRLLQLNAADGSPVRSFGADGAVSLPEGVRVARLGFTGDGDAIVLGRRDVAGPVEPSVVLRFHPDGQPDQGFRRNGKLARRLPEGGEVREKALVTDSRGRILLGGTAGRRFVLTSLLPDGRPDPRFGAGGRSLVWVRDTAKSLALRRAGAHIYLAGVTSVSPYEERRRVVLMRFDEGGRLDSSFGHRGRLTASISEPAQPTAIVPAGEGVLVVMSGGPRQLFFFGRGGDVRRRTVDRQARFVSNVRATVSSGQLVLGWSAFSAATRRHLPYLGTRPLAGR